jgi:hypothetical protein
MLALQSLYNRIMRVMRSAFSIVLWHDDCAFTESVGDWAVCGDTNNTRPTYPFDLPDLASPFRAPQAESHAIRVHFLSPAARLTCKSASLINSLRTSAGAVFRAR